MPDPSCNPYLALAVMLRAGLDGIDQKMDPGPPVNKNIYKMSHRERRHLRIDDLPASLSEALDELEKRRPHSRRARRAHLPALPRGQARGVGRATSATSRRGRPIAICASTDSLFLRPPLVHVQGRMDTLTLAIARKHQCFRASHDGTPVDISMIGRGGSPGCANYRQALASPHPGRTIHDLAATNFSSRNTAERTGAEAITA